MNIETSTFILELYKIHIKTDIKNTSIRWFLRSMIPGLQKPRHPGGWDQPTWWRFPFRHDGVPPAILHLKRWDFPLKKKKQQPFGLEPPMAMEFPWLWVKIKDLGTTDWRLCPMNWPIENMVLNWEKLDDMSWALIYNMVGFTDVILEMICDIFGEFHEFFF